MYYSTRVLSLLLLQVGLVHCFPPWDIVVGAGKRLEFYDNRTLTHTENIPSAYHIDTVTYDPVHYRVLFADNNSTAISISSFDLLTRKIQPLVTRKLSGESVRIAYDPVTQLLFWKLTKSIYSVSLNPASSNKIADENILVTLDAFPWDITVDSCGGYIYWITDYEIERARFDGSEREVLIQYNVFWRLSLAIDQQTQRIYWIDYIHRSSDTVINFVSADFNGKNRRTLYKDFIDKNEYQICSLTVSKDYFYWRGIRQKEIWQFPKNPSKNVEAKRFLHPDVNYENDWVFQTVAANYKIKEQIEGNPNCGTLKSLISNAPDSDPTDESLVCVHGMNVGASRCECTQGYTGERCEVSICHNYCVHGNCSVSAEGQPICRCNAGYSGERCEVNPCHMYCLNNGECSLNEEDEPVCECSADYEGERCEVATTNTGIHTDSTTQHIIRDVRRELRQAIQQELQRALRCFSDKIDE